MKPQTLETQILELFKTLPVDRQSAVLDELHEWFENDDGDDGLLVPAEDYLKDE